MRGEGSIYLRGKIWWISYWRQGKCYRESSKSPVKAVAHALLRKRLYIDTPHLPPVPFGLFVGTFAANITEVDMEAVTHLILQHAHPARPRSGVYFLIERQRIVYVGRSKNIDERLARHRAEKNPFDSIAILDCDADTAAVLESWFIAVLRPSRNVQTYNLHTRESELFSQLNNRHVTSTQSSAS